MAAPAKSDPGLFPVVSRPKGDDGRLWPVQIITCAECKQEGQLAAHLGRMGVSGVENAFARRGWEVGDKGTGTCPDCITERQRKKRAARAAGAPMAAQPKANGAAHDTAATPAASKGIVEMYMLLDDKYDRATKRYKGDYSDARVAKETGLAEAVVAERRNKDFGPVITAPSAAELAMAAAECGAGLQRVIDAAEAVQKAAMDATAKVQAYARLVDQAGR